MTSRAMASVALALAIFTIVVPTHAFQALGASSLERMRPISEAVTGKRPATEAEVQRLLADGMRDPDPWVRRQCVGTVATILSIGGMSPAPAEFAWAVRLRGVAEALRPDLARALDDPEPRVRIEALRGLVGPLTHMTPPAPFPLPLMQQLSARFQADESPLVRGAIVGTVQAWVASEDPEVRALAHRMLVAALRETEPAVVQTAAFGVTRSRPPEALPLLVEQLKHPSHAVRMAVAQGIASYRAAARSYLPQLEAALAAETDEITRKTLAGAITVVSR